MRTIEHPPIIDFYRNSINEGGGGGGASSRPSMKQLIHGENAQDTQIGIDEFKVILIYIIIKYSLYQ